ncbi:MAG: TonB family protein [Zoogloeaceae bacterium]|jgi:protein TonB|nr:TonB family protein [Zoogloeaceae bacterium]
MRFQNLVWKDGGGIRPLSALTVSAALHALVLWPLGPDALPPAGAPPLAATLRAAPALASAPAPKPEPEYKPAPRKTAIDPVLPRAEASVETIAPAEPVAANIPAVTSTSAISASAAPPAGRAETASAVAGGHPLATEAAAGPDADGIRDYRVGLARAARNHRHYPPLARERGWAGTAEIQIDISPQGRPPHILLARSSGHEILDQEALTMMSRAAAATALPQVLRGQTFAVRLPVTFDLTDGE